MAMAEPPWRLPQKALLAAAAGIAGLPVLALYFWHGNGGHMELSGSSDAVELWGQPSKPQASFLVSSRCSLHAVRGRLGGLTEDLFTPEEAESALRYGTLRDPFSELLRPETMQPIYLLPARCSA
eukprot:g19734.t1